MRRLNPDIFRMHRKTEVCQLQFTSLGNHFLLDWPERQLVEMSSEANEGQIEQRLQSVLAAAHHGAVTYTAAISKGEQRIARMEGTLRRKAEAKHYSYRPIPIESQRYRFVALNEIGRMLVEG